MRYVKEAADDLQPKKEYQGRPKEINLRIVRTCLNQDCERSFTAANRFIRLCDYCAGRKVYG